VSPVDFHQHYTSRDAAQHLIQNLTLQCKKRSELSLQAHPMARTIGNCTGTLLTVMVKNIVKTPL